MSWESWLDLPMRGLSGITAVDRRRYRMLAFNVVVSSLFCAILAVVHGALGQWEAVAATFGLVVLMTVNLALLRVHRNAHTAGYVAGLASTALVALEAWETGGFAGPAAEFFYVMPVIAFVVYSARVAVAVTVANAVVLTAMWSAQRAGVVAPAGDFDPSTWLAFVLIGLAAVVALMEMARFERIMTAGLVRRTRQTLGSASEVSPTLARLHDTSTLGQVAASIGHEINNPLATALAEVELALAATRAAAPSDEHIEAAHQAMGVVSGLVDDLRGFTGRAGAAERDADLQGALRDALKLVENELRHRARLVTVVPADLPRVEGDQASWTRVLVQLLGNAAQAIDDGHADRNEVRVTVTPDGAGVSVLIEDTGRGLPEGDPADLFEPFVAVGTNRTGLGLFLCRTLVESVGGDVTLTDRGNQPGTRARLWLPAARRGARPR